MKLGVCVDILDLPKVEEAAFDYVELSAVDILDPDKVNEQKFNEWITFIQRYSIRSEVFRKILPSDMKVVGEKIKKGSVKEYLDAIVPRAKRLGAEVVVWGSGESRNVPKGFSRHKAWDQLKEIISYAATLCKKEGILVALEPLNSYESNILNTIGECLRMVKELNQDVVGVAADTGHMNIDELDFEKPILDAKDKLFHVHFRDSGMRAPGLGHIPFSRVAQALEKINYRGRGTIEAAINLTKELIPARDFLRKIFSTV